MPREPFNSHCVILSKDHDYDPLVLHVQKALEKAKANLKGFSKNPPTTKSKLQKTLKNWFATEKLTDANIQSLIDSLQTAGFLELSKTNQVKYK